jgi:hypothetical protein
MVTEGEGRRRVTRGDVRAQFEASEGGGLVVILRTGLPGAAVAAPANLFEHSIRPFGLWNGRHFCDTDWHLLVFAEIVAAGEGEPRITREEGEAVLEPRSVDLYLDGTRLTDTERTSIRRFIQGLALQDDGTFRRISDGWWFQTGAFFRPGELAVGPHTFSTTTTEPGTDDFVVGPITFHVDAAGTGSCL